jgi:hypothetical protein
VHTGTSTNHHTYSALLHDAFSYLGSVQAAIVNDTVPSLPAGTNASVDSGATYSISSLSQVRAWHLCTAFNMWVAPRNGTAMVHQGQTGAGTLQLRN